MSWHSGSNALPDGSGNVHQSLTKLAERLTSRLKNGTITAFEAERHSPQPHSSSKFTLRPASPVRRKLGNYAARSRSLQMLDLSLLLLTPRV